MQPLLLDLIHHMVDISRSFRDPHQDLPVDVDFTDLRHSVAEAGWRVADCEPRTDFIDRPLGTPDSGNDADSFLREDPGAGQAFRVLDLGRGDT